MGADLSRRLLDRHVRGRADGHRTEQRQATGRRVWRAAGDDGWSGRPGATWWRRTVRAGRLDGRYLPAGQPRRPAGPGRAATDVVLVVADPDRAARRGGDRGRAYWSAVWVASDTRLTLDAARAALAAAVGAARAAQLVAGYVPVNLADTPVPPATRRPASRSRPLFVVFPPTRRPSAASWTDGAARRVRSPTGSSCSATDGRRQVSRRSGGPSPLPLYVGPDPSADPDDAIHPDGGRPEIPDELPGCSTSTARSPPGIGIAVDLTPAEAAPGFDRLVVLGVGLGRDAADGAAGAERAAARQHARPGRARAGPAGHADQQRGTAPRPATAGSTTPT